MDKGVIKSAESKINLVDYFNKYVAGIKPKVETMNVGSATICPLHDETDASFHIFVKNGKLLYKCFGCNAGGTVVSLHRAIENQYHSKKLSKEEAAIDLLKLYGYVEEVKQVQKKQTVFDTALQKVEGYSKIEINPTFNLIMYRKNNDKIVNMNGTNNIKAKQWGMLDTMLSAYIMECEDNL